jgi:hypothetical protein
VDDVQAKQAPPKEGQKTLDGRNGPWEAEHQGIVLVLPIRDDHRPLGYWHSASYPGAFGKANRVVGARTSGLRQSKDL